MGTPVPITNRPTSFDLHIRPLFRTLDLEHMQFSLDLSDYTAVKTNAVRILARLQATGHRMMPPTVDGGPWPNEWIALFERWIAEGHPE